MAQYIKHKTRHAKIEIFRPPPSGRYVFCEGRHKSLDPLQIIKNQNKPEQDILQTAPVKIIRIQFLIITGAANSDLL